MKRGIVLICAMIMSVAILLGWGNAADAPVISGSNSVVKPGGHGELSVSIDQNPGLAGFMIYIECDRSLFSLEEAESGGYLVESSDVTKSGPLTCSDYNADGWSVVWYRPTNVATNGNLFLLKVHVAENAEPGEYPVKISYSRANTVDENGARVTMNTVDGVLRVLPKEAVFSADVDAVTAPGNRFDLAVDIDANPGIASFVVYIDCDINTFSLIENDGSYLVKTGLFTDKGTCMANTNGAAGFRVIWFSESEGVDTGRLFTLPLMVSEDATLGQKSFRIRVSAVDLTDAAGTVVPIERVSNGAVTVKQMEIASLGWQTNSVHQRDEVVVDMRCLRTTEPVTLCAAIYFQNGAMKELQMEEIIGTGSAEKFIIPLTKPLQEDEIIKIFAFSDLRYIPLTAFWKIPANEDYRVEESL